MGYWTANQLIQNYKTQLFAKFNTPKNELSQGKKFHSQPNSGKST